MHVSNFSESLKFTIQYMKPYNKVLIYDDNCPLCTWYTSLFVRFGLLSSEGRIPFNRASVPLLSMIEVDTGKNEIPLIDVSNNKVYYGIDAMLDILGQKMPAIKVIGNLSPIKWFLQKLYKLISFNRKVIVAKKCGNGQFDCSPEFNVSYRIGFLLIFLVFNSVMLLPIHHHVLSALSFHHLSFAQLEKAHLLFVFTNCMLAIFLPLRTGLEYLGQVNMLALCTVLLCLPLILLSNLFVLGDTLVSTYLFLLLLFIIREYFRRMRYAGVLEKHQLVARVNFICLAAFLGYLFI